MECPLCGHDNLAGTDICEVCGGDLASADVEKFRERLSKGVLADTLESMGTLKPGTVSSDQTVADALTLMRKDLRGSVVVVDDGKIVGIFTERDLIRRVSHEQDFSSVTIAEVMTPKPFTYSPKDSIAYALNGMTAWGNRHLPIADAQEHLVGFVSVRKVLRHIKEKCASGEC